jgi:hypothetical protein
MTQQELSAQIAELTANLTKLPATDLGFASSLISQFSRKGSLTDRQIPHVTKLLQRARGDAPPVVKVGDFAGVIELFKQTSGKLKYPKITLLVENPGTHDPIENPPHTSVVLKLAGERSRNCGSVHVIARNEDRTYLGVVHPEGGFDCRVNGKFAETLIAALKELATDPVKVVTRFGRMTGNCAFCNRELSDPRSKAAGFGPQCAEAYGLMEGWRRAFADAPAAMKQLMM